MNVKFSKIKAFWTALFTLPLICIVCLLIALLIPPAIALVPMIIVLYPLFHVIQTARQYCYIGTKSLDIKIDGHIQKIRYSKIDTVIVVDSWMRHYITIRVNGKNIKLLHVKQATLVANEINFRIDND